MLGVEATSRVALFLGMLALGVALGASVGMEAIQAVCVGLGPAGQQSGITLGQSAAATCWENARLLQSVANVAGYACAALLLGGGVLDRYGAEIVAAVRTEGAA